VHRRWRCAHTCPATWPRTSRYYLLEEAGYEFGFPPSLEDYRALLACSVRSQTTPPLLPGVIFDRTPLVLPAAEMPGLRSQMNDAPLELVYDDPLNAWGDIPVLELSGPLDRRPDAVLAALDQARRPVRRHRAP
jgi:hypothetical protein